MSRFSDCLQARKFCVLLEYLPAAKHAAPARASFAGCPAFMTLADRVQADDDPAPLAAAAAYPEAADQVLHYSGKGRDIADFEKFLGQAKARGLRSLLLLTGDKLKQHNDGRLQPELRSRYLESVNMVMAARRDPDFNIGVAFNPFKYAEAERDAQYFKLQKKLKAGADYIITQLGFDLEALKQAKDFLAQAHYHQPILACVMPLTLARAQFMHRRKVAGIVLTPHALQLLEREQQADAAQAERNVYLRCALQILICRHLGFAGAHVSACHKASEQHKLEAVLLELQALSLAECEQRWHALWQLRTGQELQPEVAVFARRAPVSQVLKYKNLHAMHELFFSSKTAKGIGGLIFNAPLWNKPQAEEALLKTEFISKHGALGCESCGQCRIGETLYICPETCPKGLANGPCGGSSLDRCEFGDRECIHSVKARLAKSVDQTEILKAELIPTVAIETRRTSSWKNWFKAPQL